MSTTAMPAGDVSWWKEPTKDQWYAYMARLDARRVRFHGVPADSARIRWPGGSCPARMWKAVQHLLNAVEDKGAIPGSFIRFSSQPAGSQACVF